MQKLFIAAAGFAIAIAIGVGVAAMSLAGSRSVASAPGIAATRGGGNALPGDAGGVMGGAGGMMGGGAEIPGGTKGGLIPGSRMEALAARAAQGARISGSTVTYSGARVALVALGAPGSRPGMFWQIDGVDGPDGPTVSVPDASTITVEFADGDPGHPHGFELTTAAPPYPRMAMMAGRIAAPGAFIMPLPAPQRNLWYAASTTFRAPAPGTYYFICPVPGHAQQGMWGRLIVRPAASRTATR